MKVAELISQLGASNGADNQNGVTEYVELGNGFWAKGLSIFKSDEAGQKTLAQIGWDEERGEGPKPPVWVVVSRG